MKFIKLVIAIQGVNYQTFKETTGAEMKKKKALS